LPASKNLYNSGHPAGDKTMHLDAKKAVIENGFVWLSAEARRGADPTFGGAGLILSGYNESA